MLRTCFFWQGGGVFVGSGGVATLIDSNVYSNIASGVRCSHLCNVPSPQWMLTLHPGSQGGGVYVQSGGVANFNYCTIYENTASVSVRACSLNLPELSAIAPLKC